VLAGVQELATMAFDGPRLPIRQALGAPQKAGSGLETLVNTGEIAHDQETSAT
jgi:hypothetical protein